MPWRKLASIAMVLVVSGAFIWRWDCFGIWGSTRYARGNVTQIVFVQGRMVLRNGLSDLFASDDSGRTWRALPDRVPTLAVANGHELWGAHGWPGHHEGASAQIWR